MVKKRDLTVVNSPAAQQWTLCALPPSYNISYSLSDQDKEYRPSPSILKDPNRRLLPVLFWGQPFAGTRPGSAGNDISEARRMWLCIRENDNLGRSWAWKHQAEKSEGGTCAPVQGVAKKQQNKTRNTHDSANGFHRNWGTEVSADITYNILFEAVTSLLVLLSYQLLHKEILREGLVYKYLMQGRWLEARGGLKPVTQECWTYCNPGVPLGEAKLLRLEPGERPAGAYRKALSTEAKNTLALTSRLVKTLLYNFIRQEKCPPPVTHIFESQSEGGGLLYGLASGVASKYLSADSTLKHGEGTHSHSIILAMLSYTVGNTWSEGGGLLRFRSMFSGKRLIEAAAEDVTFRGCSSGPSLCGKQGPLSVTATGIKG
ncbi:hypothetical protein JZ751_012264 [Albula glossodonta]|uniref:Dymeclin n=1 Tax=Albula glossodonta TaxID=121402 RepID=A0A8T2PS06_9TELE|nr:hypothetical protein JZ751_012264 [Albula glossodonta]